MDPDFAVRVAAIEHVNALSRQYEDLVPRDRLAEGVQVGDRRIALLAAPYDDVLDVEAGTITYSYRVGGPQHPDNRALRAAHEMQVPLIYLMGIVPGIYSIAAPVFIVEDRPSEAPFSSRSGCVREVGGPMLREGLQGFHGAGIHLPSRRSDRPDPERLALRFEKFQAAA